MTTEVRECGMLFTTESVQAIQRGGKTQTRRVIVPQPEWKPQNKHFLYRDWAINAEFLHEHCPYGQVGDRLWVRESFWVEHDFDYDGGRAFDCGVDLSDDSLLIRYCATDEEPHWAFYSKRPSIHMPKWAARIFLEITGVRVERVQDISVKDVMAEGCANYQNKQMAVVGFASLWDSLNAKRGYSWESNCWVWAITFRLLGHHA